MSEGRRVPLMPFGGGGGDAAADAKKRRTEPLSVRLTFVLPESTESTCPVYNYQEELTAAKKRDKSKQQNGKSSNTNGLDPFDEDDDDVKRIAMEMEAKYGTGPPSKKKRKNRRDDYADIGMGYDESDSFIDNTDGYDEIIPQNVTTLHGGFYINCGALEFKTDEGVSSDLSSESSESSSSSEDEDDDGESKKEPSSKTSANRKRMLDTSESEGENEADKTDKADKKQKSGAVTNGGLQPKKKKKEGGDERKAATPLENHKDRPPPKKVVPAVVASCGATTITSVVLGDDKRHAKEKDKDVSRDSVPVFSVTPVVQQQPSGNSDGKVRGFVEQLNSDKKHVEVARKDGGGQHEAGASAAGDNGRLKAGKDLQLPANLPSNILDIIKRIKDNVQKNRENNKEIFNGVVNNLLTTFERKSKVLGKQSRSRIYQHMASLMKTEKENLCKRAKLLVMTEDAKRLAALLCDLKAAVMKAMVPLRDAYDRDLAQIKNLKSTESEESKSLRMPKRKFAWADDTRKMLREIIIIKKRLLIYEGKTKESIEIHLNLFIKSDVQVIWPDGWMTMAALFKLCSSFEKKPPAGLNNSALELNSSSEAIMPPPQSATLVSSKVNSAPPPSLNCAQAQAQGQQQHQKAKGEKKDAAAKSTKMLSTKDLQKFQANSVSITPVAQENPAQAQAAASKPAKVLKVCNDASAGSNKIDGLGTFEPPRGLSISQISPPAAHKSTIQARSIYKPDKQNTPPPAVDRTTKFVNMAQNDSLPTTPENLTKKLSTDYNIESIMRKSDKDRGGDSSAASPACVTSSAKRTSDIIIPKEEPDGGSPGSTASSVVTKIPIENFMPRPIVMDVKEEIEEDVIILDDTLDDEPSAPSNLSRGGGGNLSGSSSGELRRKPGPKSKTKYVDAAMIKTAKSASTVTTSSDKKLKPDAPKEKKDVKNDADDMLKLMENLKELNKMTTPSKSVDTSPASAVSVIAFNKNFAKSPTASTASSASAKSAHELNKPTAAEYASGLAFNDAYQRQFLNSLSATSTPAPSASSGAVTKSYNSAHASSYAATQEKHYNSNNNYTTAPGQQAAKYKNSYPPQHTGTYNLMDDMLANFITEYAYPKTGNHKQKPTQK